MVYVSILCDPSFIPNIYLYGVKSSLKEGDIYVFSSISQKGTMPEHCWVVWTTRGCLHMQLHSTSGMYILVNIIVWCFTVY